VDEFPEADQGTPVNSPFTGVHSTVHSERKNSSRQIWLVPAIFGVGVAAMVIFFAQKAIYDPLRTLQPFPVKEYYENHASLEGTRFKVQLKVINQLGWKDEVGRLIIFNVGSSDNPVVVLVSTKQDTLSFEPGDTYQAELRVGEGGLLKADHLKKE